jgi:hypothetical protein
MKKNFYLAIALLGFSVSLNAQTAKKGVGIKTDTPQTTLDVRAEATDTSMPDGVLVPRLDVGQLNAKSGVYGADQNGALVFVTSNTQGTPGTKVENVKDPGFYYYDHATSKWKGVGGGSSGQISGALHANVPTNVRTVTSLPSSAWTATDYGLILGSGFSGNMSLPDATTNSGRILFVVNQTGGAKVWAGSGGQFKPLNSGNLLGGRAIMVVSDGNVWQPMAGYN